MNSTKSKVVFEVPTRDQVSEANQLIFDKMKAAYGKVPNIYATLALNETALGDYLALQNRKNTLTAKEREIINLVVSQVNNCNYCLPAHTAVSKMLGLNDAQILEIRKAEISFDERYDALAKFVKDVAVNRGRPSEESYNNFFDAGYTKSNLIDVMIIIGDKMISNYFHNTTQLPVDWEPVPAI